MDKNRLFWEQPTATTCRWRGQPPRCAWEGRRVRERQRWFRWEVTASGSSTWCCGSRSGRRCDRTDTVCEVQDTRVKWVCMELLHTHDVTLTSIVASKWGFAAICAGVESGCATSTRIFNMASEFRYDPTLNGVSFGPSSAAGTPNSLPSIFPSRTPSTSGSGQLRMGDFKYRIFWP